MIISVSIVDRHKPKGKRHVGTYTFEIDYPASEHEGQMEFLTVDCPKENEDYVRPMVNVLHTLETMPDPMIVVTRGNQVIDTTLVDNKGNPRS